MDFRFSGSSVDLTEKDKSVNEANLTLPQGCGHLYYTVKNILKCVCIVWWTSEWISGFPGARWT